MIIDCHTHIGRNEHINSSVNDLLNSMDRASINKSLVFAGELNDAPNEWMLEQIAPHTDRLIGVACASPMRLESGTSHYISMSKLQDEVKQIVDWYGEGKIAACKFYTGYDHYYPNDRIIEDYLMEFEETNLPVIFHMGDCLNSVKCAKLKYAQPLFIDDIAVDYPNLKIIIAHMAYPWHRDAAEVCYKNPNVYADISGFVYGKFTGQDQINFRKVIQEFEEVCPRNKLLFGTDFPISNQESYINMVHSKSLIDNVVTVFKL